MLNQSKDSFLSDTKKNPKDYMAVTLRSCRELESRKEDKKKKIEKKKRERRKWKRDQVEQFRIG